MQSSSHQNARKSGALWNECTGKNLHSATVRDENVLRYSCVQRKRPQVKKSAVLKLHFAIIPRRSHSGGHSDEGALQHNLLRCKLSNSKYPGSDDANTTPKNLRGANLSSLRMQTSRKMFSGQPLRNKFYAHNSYRESHNASFPHLCQLLHRCPIFHCTGIRSKLCPTQNSMAQTSSHVEIMTSLSLNIQTQ